MTDKNLRITDKHIFFWNGWPSNWYPAKIKVKIDEVDRIFNNSEQYFMYLKAKKFDDAETAKRILENGSNPKEAKRLGRLVKNFNNEMWEKVRMNIMFEANWKKYIQQ